MIDYVLKKPRAEERAEIDKAMAQALGGLDLLLAGEMEKATMKINARPPRPKPPAAAPAPTPAQVATAPAVAPARTPPKEESP